VSVPEPVELGGMIADRGGQLSSVEQMPIPVTRIRDIGRTLQHECRARTRRRVSCCFDWLCKLRERGIRTRTPEWRTIYDRVQVAMELIPRLNVLPSSDIEARNALLSELRTLITEGHPIDPAERHGFITVASKWSAQRSQHPSRRSVEARPYERCWMSSTSIASQRRCFGSG
jgi:hypothetical protein